MPETSAFVPVDTLESFMIDVFGALGVPLEDAHICADVLIASDLWGIESHGVGRLKTYHDRIRAGIQSPVTGMEVVRDTPTTAVVDGGHGMGQVIAYRSMGMAIEKARRHGLATVAVRNSAHFGIAGYYAWMAVKAGMIGLAMTNARPSVAPTFGVQPMLGTNPIAFGAPTDEPFPFLFDAATSIVQRGRIEVLERLGGRAREGWVIDQVGAPITDCTEILRRFDAGTAAFLPLGGATEEGGGHKGFGLATMVEILCASLQSGGFLHGLSGVTPDGSSRPLGLGHFFLAVDIERFVPLGDFKRTTGDIVRQLRGAAKAPGHDRIYTAGEKEFESEQRVRANGVEINARLAQDIRAIQKGLGLSHYNFGLPSHAA